MVFRPKLDENDATSSVQEVVETWVEEFLKRAHMVKPFEAGLKVLYSESCLSLDYFFYYLFYSVFSIFIIEFLEMPPCNILFI